jgi:threonine/homoserine efflux transporter RhtA
MNPTDLVQLGQYGLIGVMLALIFLTGGVIWILYKIVGNHINHNTSAMGDVAKNIDANTRLTERVITLLEKK